MLRYIANRFAGRRKSTDKSLSVSEATKLLGRLNGSTKGNISYAVGLTAFSLSGVAPRDMVNFVEDKFSTSKNYYSDIGHQVYSGESGNKHYLELAHGEIKGIFGATKVKGRPYRIATIDFLVQEE
jgi:hypothetical protein